MGKKDIKSEMGEYIPESTAATVSPVLTGNSAFKIIEHGKPLYVGMLLDVAKIGGINKKSINDKDKGGVIESIKSGHIDVYSTEETNNNNELLFIPTASTIDRLGDYGLFRKVDGYEFVKLNSKMEFVERTGITGTYDDFRNILNGQAKITDFVKPADVIVKGSDEDPTVNHNPLSQFGDKVKDIASNAVGKGAAAVSKVVDTVKEKVSESSGIKDMVDKPAEKKQADSPAEKPDTKPQAEQGASETSVEALSPDEIEQDITYTETQVLSACERTFHADNMDLPVSAEPFDQLFTLNNHLIKFDIDSRDTYVNERLNVMATDANRDLQKLRADNLRSLREKYFMLMAARVIEIQKEMDVKDESTEYGKKRWLIESDRKNSLDKISGLIEEKRQALEADYNKNLEEYCDAAAKKARSDYNNSHQRTLNDSLSRVESLVKADIDNDYNAAINKLYADRRNDALTLLDLNITGVLQELAEDYKLMFEEENKLYNKRAEEMRDYVKELRNEDAKRLAAEEERNRISNEVNDARAEAAAKIELIKKEYETAQAALEARSNATIAQAENQTTLIKEQMDLRTATLEQDKEKLQKQLDDAIERANNAQDAVREDYEHRLAQAQDDRDSWKQTLDSYKEQHRHNNILAAILVIAITVAAVAGGFVAGGVYWNRFVAGELSSGQSDVAINVIDPKVTTSSETSASSDGTSDVPEEADEDDTAVTTTVPDDESGLDETEKSGSASSVTTASAVTTSVSTTSVSAATTAPKTEKSESKATTTKPILPVTTAGTKAN